MLANEGLYKLFPLQALLHPHGGSSLSFYPWAVGARPRKAKSWQLGASLDACLPARSMATASPVSPSACPLGSEGRGWAGQARAHYPP